MITLSQLYNDFSTVIRIGRNTSVVGVKSQYTPLAPRSRYIDVQFSDLEIYDSSQSASTGLYPFTTPSQYGSSSSNTFRGSTVIATRFSNIYSDPRGIETNFPESTTAQNAGMSVEFILNRYAAGQALPVQNRSMRADSDSMTDAEMKNVRVISSTLEAEAYIREVNAAKAAADAAEAAKAAEASKAPSAEPPTSTE